MEGDESGQRRVDEYTQDGTVDLKGNPVLRSKRGGWTACSFVVPRIVLHLSSISSALLLWNNLQYWLLVDWLMNDNPSSFTPFPQTTSLQDPHVENCKKASTLHLAVFYGALYTLAIGTGGTKPNISTIGADQFDDFDPKEKDRKLSFFNWWMFIYIQDNVGWALGYGLPTLGLLISILIFLAGTPFYRHKLPSASPFTRMAKVPVAALRKWRVTLPSDPKELDEFNLEEYAKKGNFRIDSTPTLRFLNKAAVKIGSTSPWMLCSVTQVEETKQRLRMIPILAATFIPSTMIAQVNTLFVKQGTTLDRSLGSFKIPRASLAGFVTLSMLVSVVLYDRFFVRIMQRVTKNPRGITLLQRMGIGMVFHVFIMVVASLTERYRLHLAKQHGVVESGGQVPITILLAKIEFFYDQAPENMKSLGTSFAMTTLGMGNFISSFLLSTVSHITKKHGHKGWILNNLNASHLDYYYAFFAVLNVFNVIFFLFMTKMYVYKAEISDSIKVLTEELRETTYKASNEGDSRKGRITSEL
ncbi:unnamed protein product [Malus baccata var. baccata]